MTPRRAALSLAAALLAAAPLAAQRAVDVHRATTPTVSIRIVGSFAELHIRAWDRDSVTLTGSIPADAKFDGAFGGGETRPAPGMKFYLETASGTPAGKLELRVPAGARVWAKSGSADIDATGVTGGLDLSVVGGSVRVAGNPHEVNIEAMDGNVNVDGSPAWLRAKTATGDIVVAGGSPDAALTTVSGAIKVTGGAYERARLESVTGPITFAGDLVHGASLDINTHSGAIELLMLRKAGADFDLATAAGSIENALTGRPAVPGREGRGQEIGFATGPGGARVYARSFKGSIRILPR